MMHTAKSLAAMKPEAATKIAESMALDLFGHDRFKAELAERVGVKRQTVNNWFATRPPTLAILYMQSEIARRDAEGRLSALRNALARL